MVGGGGHLRDPSAVVLLQSPAVDRPADGEPVGGVPLPYEVVEAEHLTGQKQRVVDSAERQPDVGVPVARMGEPGGELADHLTYPEITCLFGRELGLDLGELELRRPVVTAGGQHGQHGRGQRIRWHPKAGLARTDDRSPVGDRDGGIVAAAPDLAQSIGRRREQGCAVERGNEYTVVVGHHGQRGADHRRFQDCCPATRRDGDGAGHRRLGESVNGILDVGIGDRGLDLSGGQRRGG
jgi:hypothetical protein